MRYSTFFHHHAHLIPGVLESFLQLVHHPVRKVKTRSWYLFQRLVKQLRTMIGNVAQTVVEALGDLLVIQAEVPSEGEDGDEMSSEDHEGSADAVFNSQLYLFEAVGIICSTHGVPADKQVLYAQSVLNPIFADMERNLEAAKANDERALLQIHHDIMALGTLARGFSDWMPGTNAPANLPAPEVSEAFGQVAEATLVALESLKTSFNIRTAARFAFSRLIGVLGARILPQLPRWIDGLLTQTSSRDEMALFLRLLDQVIFGFKGEIYSILDTLLTPFLQRVFSGIADPTTGTDDEIQLAELKREYLNFLLAVLNNDLGAVIISESKLFFPVHFDPGTMLILAKGTNLSSRRSSPPSSTLPRTLMTSPPPRWRSPCCPRWVAAGEDPTLPPVLPMEPRRLRPRCLASAGS